MSDPTGPDQLTADWLTAKLRVGGHLTETGTVTAVGVQRVGTGQMAACYRLELTVDGDSSAPTSVIAKLPSPDAGSRGFAQQLGAYEREVLFYRDVAPELDCRTPVSYIADVNEDGSSFVLLLEDLSPATECEQIGGCTPDQARVALGQAAGMHASSWDNERINKLDWIHAGLALWQGFAAGIGDINAGFQARYADLLADEQATVGDQLASGALAAWVGRQQNPRCLFHADFRLDNMLFDAAGGTVPVAVVDWQSVTMAGSPIDVAYFIGAGLPVDVRRQHEEELVRSYHAALTDQGVSNYSWDDCWNDYRANAVAGFVVAAVAAISVERTDRGDEMFMTMARRHADHIADLDAFGAIGG